MHFACAANRLRRRLGETEITDLARFHELSHRADGIFDRRIGIDAMLIVKIDSVGAEALQTGFASGADVFGTPGYFAPGRIIGISHDSELGRDCYFVAPAANRFADQFLVAMRSVSVGGIPEGDAELERALQRVHRLRIVAGPVKIRHAHASESERRYGKAASSEVSYFHRRFLIGNFVRVARLSTARRRGSSRRYSFDSVARDALESRR